MSYLPQSKFGDCTQCPSKDTECVKRGKELWCLNCNNRRKAEEQVAKANRRNAARNLGNKLRRENILGSQYSEEYEASERSALIHDIDFVFSRIIRMMYSESNGQCQCYTCSTVKHFSLMQCGHFESRKNSQIRWSFLNARPQCQTCNEMKHGNIEVFAERLEQEEKGIVDRLREISREPYKWGRDELKQLLIDLRAKLKIIETKFNQPSTIT